MVLQIWLLLGVAAWHDFCMKWLLHFCKFLVNPNIDFKPNYFFQKPTDVSNDILSIPKYSELFMHKSKTFLLKKYAIQTNGVKKTPKLPLSLAERGPPFNTHIPRLTPLTTSNNSSITSCAFTQYPHWLQWMPQIHPTKLPLLLRWSPPPFNTPSLDWLHSTPQMASGSNQPFCHNTLSGQTHRPTDGIGKQINKKSAYALLYTGRTKKK